MRSQYASLCSKFSDRYGRKAFDGFAHFAGMKGREYDDQDRLRLMLVGRSVNGWPSYSAGLDSVSFGNRMEAVFRDESRSAFDWIKPDPRKPCSFTNGDEYRLGASRFWNYSGEIWKELNNTVNCPAIQLADYDFRWFEFIAWTNLYKITEQGKTPGIRMTRLQLPECRDILREEIEAYAPTLIVMETDESWFSSFSPLFSSVNVTRNPIVRITAKHGRIPVAVTIRPELQSKEFFVRNAMGVINGIL